MLCAIETGTSDGSLIAASDTNCTPWAKWSVTSAARAIANLVLPQPRARSTSAACCPGGGPGPRQSRIPCPRSSSAAGAGGSVRAWRRPFQGRCGELPHPNQRSSTPSHPLHADRHQRARLAHRRPRQAARIGAMRTSFAEGRRPRFRCSHPLPSVPIGIAAHRPQIALSAKPPTAPARAALQRRTAGQRAFSRTALVAQRHTVDRHRAEADLRFSTGWTGLPETYGSLAEVLAETASSGGTGTSCPNLRAKRGMSVRWHSRAGWDVLDFAVRWRR